MRFRRKRDGEASTAAEEAHAIVRERAAALEGLSWDELDAYEKQSEDVVTPSGRRIRLVMFAFWDTNEWQSDIYIYAKAYPATGWRRFWAYTGHGFKAADDPADPLPRLPERREKPA